VNKQTVFEIVSRAFLQNQIIYFYSYITRFFFDFVETVFEQMYSRLDPLHPPEPKPLFENDPETKHTLNDHPPFQQQQQQQQQQNPRKPTLYVNIEDVDLFMKQVLNFRNTHMSLLFSCLILLSSLLWQ
jgi:hypothetical protein